MNLPTEDQILEALNKSGYLFEQDVATRIANLDFHVETNWAYLDSDLEKSREVDVRAVKRVHHDEDLKFSVFVELLIECKDFDAPIVFLERAKNAREANHIDPKEYIFPRRVRVQLPNKSGFREVSVFEHLQLNKHHYYYKEPNKTTQFSKIVRKGQEWVANHDGIYDSLILPLAKLLQYRRSEMVRSVGGPGFKSVWLIFPMVVVRDHLMVYDLSRPNRTLHKRGRVSFIRHFDAEPLKGHYLTDFITFDALEDYLCQEIAPFYSSVIQFAKEKPSLFSIQARA